MNEPILKFKPKLPRLSINEQKVLNLLIEAGELIAPIYLLQENNQYLGANFYPHNISKQEIELAVKKDPLILNPYTVVEKQGGKLVAVPYHQKYYELLKPVSAKLLQAAKITDNREFSKRLKIQSQALLDGSYDQAAKSWMSMKPYIIDINIGPIERYNDKLFFVKTAYQSWVGVRDEEETKKLANYKETVLTVRRQSLMPSEKVDYYDKVQIRIDDVLIMSGFLSRTPFVGVNLPNNTHLMEKYGSEITIFKQTNEIRHKRNINIMKQVLDPKFRQQFSEEDLRTGSLYSTALHEIAHTYLRYHGSEHRLADLFPIIDELSATVAGIKVCGSLLLKDIATQKQLESIMLAYLVRSFYLIFNEMDYKPKYHYSMGGVIYINYLIETGALKIANGISWPNFMKMFVSLNDLVIILEKLLTIGTRKDAEVFISKYGDYKRLQKFKKS